MQVWHILRGKNKTPFFVSTPTHTVPQEPRFESLQEDLDILFGAEPPVFPPRLLALKDGIAEWTKESALTPCCTPSLELISICTH